MLCKKLDEILKYFSIFPSKTDTDISCKETICMNGQSLLSGETEKLRNKINLSSAQ